MGYTSTRIMQEITIIFPHQLFEHHPAVSKERPIFVVEDPHFFTRYHFHIQKLMYHYATIREYAKYLETLGHTVHLISLNMNINSELLNRGIKHVHMAEFHDDVLEKKIRNFLKELNVALTVYESPYFMTSPQRFHTYFAHRERFFFTSFYSEQRHYFDILMKNGKPRGGTLSFDPSNRKKLPAHSSIPHPFLPHRGASINAAHCWVLETFPHNPGKSDKTWLYPVTFDQARRLLDHFLEHRLTRFGPYQDALNDKHPLLFHSLLSAVLNVGLLTPSYVIERTLAYSRDHPRIPLNSLEGFIRQIIGWREFVYGIYKYKGHIQKTSNFFEHTRPLPRAYWNATTGLYPVDISIQHALSHAYAHHIERLMVLGNTMLLCEIAPYYVYQWFMEFFIDAYDWVMIPNVYGMSQYADGGLMTTKPYIASSHYLKKMSNFPSGSWEATMDGLYWRFLNKNKQRLATIPRAKIMLSALYKIDSLKLKQQCKIAEAFLNHLA